MAKTKQPWRIEFEFPGEPLTKSNAHHFKRGRVYIPKRIVNYERALHLYAKAIMRKLKRRVTGKLLKIKIVYYLGTKRRKDLLNLPKTTCDALNAAAYKDDFQIHKATIERHLDRDNPRVHLVIEEMSDSKWEQG